MKGERRKRLRCRALVRRPSASVGGGTSQFGVCPLVPGIGKHFFTRKMGYATDFWI
jgi:hypothetical protein